ncbi:hypothetical protein AAHE18_13G303900 [Arachis hypogaea]
METKNELEPKEGLTIMLPPPPGTFQDREDLIKHVCDFGANERYVVTIKKSRKDRRVILGCDRRGVYHNRHKIEESKRKRKATSRLINCPFEAIVKQIKLMTEAGIKPRQVLKTLKQSNLQLQSTPRHLYNLKAKIRQGKLSDKTFKSLRSNRSMSVEGNNSSSDGSLNLNYHLVPNFIGATQEVVSQVPLTTYEEFKAAIVAAKQAFPSWKNTPITTRQRIMFKLQDLIHRDIDKLAMNITTEQGKTLKGARGDVLHGLEMVEHACGMANLQMGEFVPNACNGIDTYCIRDPLGVCAGICPINFPAMTPLWMFPIAITCGNTFILKPCENNPGASMILVALAMEAGLPDGVLNVVHGTHEIVNYICDDEDIKAVSFNGSITISLKQGCLDHKSNAGGINHVVVMPDASMDATLDALVSAGFRAAGERSMALNTAIFVGGSMQWEDELVQRAKALRVNVGTDPDAYLGPVISREVKDRICGLVQNAVENGARLLLDGRHIMVPGYENGNFVGPTILCDVTTNMECYKEEIFGPVLLCMQADNLDEAVSIINKNRYSYVPSCRSSSVFTDSGMVARKFQHEVEAVLVGINVPVPIPLPFSSNYESKASFAGNFNFCGRTGVQFCTQIKKVAKRWKVDSSMKLAPQSLPLQLQSNSPTYEVQLAIADADIQNTAISSATAPADKDIRSQHVSLVLSPSSQASERIGVSKPSQWNENLPATSQKSETIPQTSEQSHVTSSEMNVNLYTASQEADTATVPALKSDEIYMSMTHEVDDLAQISPRIDADVSKSIGETFEKSDTMLTSERIYMPVTTSHTTDIGLSPTSEKVYVPSSSASHRHKRMN